MDTEEKGETDTAKACISTTWIGVEGGVFSPHPKVGAEDVWVAACYQQDAPDTLTQQLWSIQVLQDGLQAAHHQLGTKTNPTQPIITQHNTKTQH